MKIILGIICGLVVLFAGGCAIMLVVAQATDSGAAALALIPGGIAALNVLVLMALFGKSQPQRSLERCRRCRRRSSMTPSIGRWARRSPQCSSCRRSTRRRWCRCPRDR